LRRRLDVLCGPVPIVPGMWWFGRAGRETMLAALEDASYYRSDGHMACDTCTDTEPCGEHVPDLAIADTYDDLNARLSRAGQRR
jgi:hypothetical protein